MPFAHEHSRADDRVTAETRVRTAAIEDANRARSHAAASGDYATAEHWLGRMKQIAALETRVVPSVVSAVQNNSPGHPQRHEDASQADASHA